MYVEKYIEKGKTEEPDLPSATFSARIKSCAYASKEPKRYKSASIRLLEAIPISIYPYTSILETTALIFQEHDVAHQILKIQSYIF